jgi:hypothetical protein
MQCSERVERPRAGRDVWLAIRVLAKSTVRAARTRRGLAARDRTFLRFAAADARRAGDGI